MLLNNAISILSNGRLALGDLGLKIARNIEKGIVDTPEQKELYRRLVLTYACLFILDPILPIENGRIKYVLGDYPDNKVNRILLYLQSVSGAGNLPVVWQILNPITGSQIGGGPPGPPGDDGDNAYVYIGYADDADGNGYSTSPVDKDYIAFKQSNVPISPVTGETFAGLWKKYVGDEGAPGDDGEDGDSSYVFQAWADDADGNGFTLTFDPAKKYTGFIIKSDPELPVVDDFDGLWGKYIGDNGEPGEDGDDGQSAYLYVGYADDSSGTGFTLTFDPAKDWIAVLNTTTELTPPVAGDFDGLWKKYKGEQGEPGEDGEDGTDGQNQYLYIAYADDSAGNGFTTSFNSTKEWIAFLQSSTPIDPLTQANFDGLWSRYKGGGDRYKTTSTTPLTIGTGSQYLQVEPGLSYIGGQQAIIVLPNNPNVKMEGEVVFYDSATGQMEMDVTDTEGSGTYSTWNVNIMGASGGGGGGSGDVTGPPTSNNDEIALFDGPSGKIIKGSGIYINDTDPLDDAIDTLPTSVIVKEYVDDAVAGATIADADDATKGKAKLFSTVDEVTPRTDGAVREDAMISFVDTKVAGATIPDATDTVAGKAKLFSAVNEATPRIDGSLNEQEALRYINTLLATNGLLGRWQYLNAITVSDPLNQKFKLNSLTPSAVTIMCIDFHTVQNIDGSRVLGALQINDTIRMQQANDNTIYHVYKVTALPINQGSWFEIAVAPVSVGATMFVNNMDVLFSFPNSSVPNATDTIQGLVEKATPSEVDAGTAVGGSGAPLFVGPAEMVASRNKHKRVTANITGAVTIDLSLGDLFELTLTGNVTSFSFSNEALDKEYVFVFKKDTSEKTLVWAATKYRFPYGGAPVLTDPTTNGTTGPARSVDIVTAICNVAGRLDVVITPNMIEN